MRPHTQIEAKQPYPDSSVATRCGSLRVIAANVRDVPAIAPKVE